MIKLFDPVFAWLATLVKPFDHAEGPPPNTLWAFSKWLLAGSWPILGIAALISAFGGVMEAGTALIIGAVIDAVEASGPSGFFAENLGLVLFCLFFFLILRPFAFGANAAFNSYVIPPNILPLTMSRLHRWTMGHSVTFFDNDFAGRIAQKQMQTATAITTTVHETINVVPFALASMVGSIALLLTIQGWVAAILAVWVLAYLAMITWFLPRIRARSKARAAVRAAVTGQVVDTITNIKTVKLFGHADHEDTAALNTMGALREKAMAFGKLSTGFRFSLMVLAGLLPILLIGATILLWQRGAASTGDIAAAGVIAVRLAQMTGWVSFTLLGIYSHIGEIEDGMRTLTPPHDLLDAPRATELAVTQGGIEMAGLGFAYGQETGGVDGIDLAIAPGEKLGIVGASGAGKSTLVGLLLRLYDPEAGVIRIDGTDIRTVTQDSLRQQIGMVTQETAMFNRSAFDNIRYGRPEASDDEVRDAARRAEAHEFIEELEDYAGRKGYDAYLGERGVKLSGGQRQRIAIARALLKDAPILVLDEATSALDSEVEASIQQALRVAMSGKTVIAIAHRLSTIARMDRIVVMDQGRIVEEGTHETLLAKGGLYAGYWDRQSGGFIGITEAAE